ncbi:hypothetical protein ACFOMD_09250 [Sphingoaurantiacus capsulatus]|uniref:Uncharacterized protein n=1 Tax=Sphingoaurantiacus capsulatus TaxID=1771310 RepID=A0ABV7X9E9_9SPHN
MPRRFLLERVYTNAEYDAGFPAPLRAVGTMLDAAIDGPPPNPEMKALLSQLSEQPKAPRLS